MCHIQVENNNHNACDRVWIVLRLKLESAVSLKMAVDRFSVCTIAAR